jgi:magnesium chelatase family protein
MNPCPCGYQGDPQGECRCSVDRVINYRSKISGPLLDRIDMHVEVGRPPNEVLRSDVSGGDSSVVVAQRVRVARQTQMQRAGICNARLSGERLSRVCSINEDSWMLIESAAERFNLSARAHQRVLRVARTIADLAGVETITPPHVAEALSLRSLDRRY